MAFSKTTNRGRIGSVKPARFTLVKALSGMREKCYRNADGKSRFYLTAKEMVVLGQLINSWKDIVGIQLAKKTCPIRLIKGKLHLAVADSQWLQTLVFLKAKIIAKLNQAFPDFKITEIIGKPGQIPEEVEKLVAESEWPDFKDEEAPDYSHVKDPELASLLQRCHKKLNARLKGLEKRGLILCSSCQATVTSSVDTVCALCKHESRHEKLNQIRGILHEMPWLELEELEEIDSSLSLAEFQAIRLELLETTLAEVKEIFEELLLEYDEKLLSEMKREMIRSVMLYCGKMPDQVDLNNLSEEEIPDRNWHSYLCLTQEGDLC